MKQVRACLLMSDGQRGSDMTATVETYRDEHFGAVKALWDQAYPFDPPWNRAEIVIPAKIAHDRTLLQVALDEKGAVIGAALAGYDGHRGWLYSVTVDPSRRRMRVASLLLDQIERHLRSMGCKKVNVQIVSMNVAFVRFCHSRGYTVADRIIMGKQL